MSLVVVSVELLREETGLSTQTIIGYSLTNTMALATQHMKSKDFPKIQCFECKNYGMLFIVRKEIYVPITRRVAISFEEWYFKCKDCS